MSPPSVFTALADPTRRTILDELIDRDGQTLFEICARLTTKHGLGSSRQAVSQHLNVLEAAGLVETRRDGRYKSSRSCLSVPEFLAVAFGLGIGAVMGVVDALGGPECHTSGALPTSRLRGRSWP